MNHIVTGLQRYGKSRKKVLPYTVGALFAFGLVYLSAHTVLDAALSALFGVSIGAFLEWVLS